jgi:hypothetical protein
MKRKTAKKLESIDLNVSPLAIEDLHLRSGFGADLRSKTLV